ncbi:YcxB family protein [Kribbella sp. NPDC055071]
MDITISVEGTLRRRLRLARAQLRWVGWAFRGFGVLCLLLAALVGPDATVVTVGILCLIYPEIVGVMRQVLAKKYGRVYTYTLTDSGVTVRTAISKLEFGWDALTSVRETATDWQLRLPGAGFLMLPKQSFTPEQAAQWRAFLVARGAVAA